MAKPTWCYLRSLNGCSDKAAVSEGNFFTDPPREALGYFHRKNKFIQICRLCSYILQNYSFTEYKSKPKYLLHVYYFTH